MTSTEDVVEPTPEEVARLVEALLASDWPTTEEERAAWFDRHAIRVEGATLDHEEHGSESWSVRPEAGATRTGWHVFEGEFVGVSWFLWDGGSPTWDEVWAARVGAAATELRERLIALVGPPTEESWLDDFRFTSFWETGGRSVDLYLHGGPVLGGDRREGPVVQLHVDDVARARRADAAAQSASEAGPDGRASES